MNYRIRILVSCMTISTLNATLMHHEHYTLSKFFQDYNKEKIEHLGNVLFCEQNVFLYSYNQDAQLDFKSPLDIKLQDIRSKCYILRQVLEKLKTGISNNLHSADQAKAHIIIENEIQNLDTKMSQINILLKHNKTA